jgi:DNA-binding NtrC family response regulator
MEFSDQCRASALSPILPGGASAALTGYRFIVIEDEMVQALQLGRMLQAMGGVLVRTAYAYEQAWHAINGAEFDCAILDINLAGTLSFRLADVLHQRQTPFIFCTAHVGGTGIYPGISDVPMVDKPVRPLELRDALLQVLRSRRLAEMQNMSSQQNTSAPREAAKVE